MEKYHEHRRHTGSFWAWVLIIMGMLWIMKSSGWDINLPGFGEFFAGIGRFFGSFSHWSDWTLLPWLIIFIGILLIAGRRFFGALLFVLILMIVLPHFMIIPGILMILFFPVFLIILGIIILSKLF